MKNKNKNELDGIVFQTKKDLNYFIHLEELQLKGIIREFSFDYNIDEKTGIKKHTSKNTTIDDICFYSKTDADYYTFLKNLVFEGEIDSFVFPIIQNNSKGKSKYSAKKVIINENTFDSKTEAEYYILLNSHKKQGVILDFKLQPVFELQPAFEKLNKKYRKIEYIADFEVYQLDGTIDVIDVKGMITPEFSLKRKMFEYKYPDKTLILMKYVEKYGGWVSFEEWNKLKKENKK